MDGDLFLPRDADHFQHQVDFTDVLAEMVRFDLQHSESENFSDQKQQFQFVSAFDYVGVVCSTCRNRVVHNSAFKVLRTIPKRYTHVEGQGFWSFREVNFPVQGEPNLLKPYVISPFSVIGEDSVYLPDGIKNLLDSLMSPILVIPIVVCFCLYIFYLKSVSKGNKAQIQGLKSTMVSERDEFKKKIEIEKSKNQEGGGGGMSFGVNATQRMSLKVAEKLVEGWTS